MTIFLAAHGETLRFENVRNLEWKDNKIGFDYTSASDHIDKTAEFRPEAVAGVSTWEE